MRSTLLDNDLLEIFLHKLFDKCALRHTYTVAADVQFRNITCLKMDDCYHPSEVSLSQLSDNSNPHVLISYQIQMYQWPFGMNTVA